MECRRGRAEIRVDKLYAPDSPTGRLGLVEFRAFEMPPHPRMALAQSLVLRAPTEPWHVLGETGAVGGTTRFVDSSLERVQIRLVGTLDDRFAVTCNGIRVPMTRTDRNDGKITGIRFRALQPPLCLHPTIGVHTPPTLDLYDTWSGRAVGGRTHHVGHPDGRGFETQPVNDLEAEGRRLARFFPHGNNPGSYTPCAGSSAQTFR